MTLRNNRENFQHGSTGQKLVRCLDKNFSTVAVWTLTKYIVTMTYENHKKIISHFGKNIYILKIIHVLTREYEDTL